MSTADKDGFNAELFGKLVALFDSAEEGEAASALHLARGQLKAKRKKFYEAFVSTEFKTYIWAKFQPICMREEVAEKADREAQIANLRSQIAALDAKLGESRGNYETLQADSAELARGFTKEQKLNDALRAEKTKNEAVWRKAVADRDGIIAQWAAAHKNVESKGKVLERRLEEEQGISAKLRGKINELHDALRLCPGCESKRRLAALIAAWPIGDVWFSVFPWKFSQPWQRECGLFLMLLPFLAVFLRWELLQFKRKISYVSLRNNDIYRHIAGKWNGLLGRLEMRGGAR